MKEKDYVGVLPDNRSEEEQAKDWQATELASAESLVPKFRTVKKNGWKKYTLRDQDGSGSCVSQALAKGFEVLYKLETGKTVMFSSVPIYQKRQNKPYAGMYIVDAFNIAVKYGTCPEEFCKSQKMTDAQMDSAKIPENFEDLNNFVDAVAFLNLPKDFDYVAGWVEKYGYAQIHISASRACWSLDFPKLGSLNRGINHAVAVVDAVTYKKVEYLVIEDSWGEFGEFKGQRLISREVFNDMFTKGAGLTVVKYNVTDTTFAPFTAQMKLGDRSDAVKHLQKYLQAKGFFPADMEATGYYGEVTAKAVLNWQIAKKVDNQQTLNALKGYNFGPKSIKVANANL